MNLNILCSTSVQEVSEFQTRDWQIQFVHLQWAGDVLAQWCTIGGDIHFHFLGCKARDEPCASVIARREWRRASASMECGFHNARSLVQLRTQRFQLRGKKLMHTGSFQFNSIHSFAFLAIWGRSRPLAAICEFWRKADCWSTPFTQSGKSLLLFWSHFVVAEISETWFTVAQVWREIVSPQADAESGLIKAHWKSLEGAFSSGISTLLRSTKRFWVSTNSFLNS